MTEIDIALKHGYGHVVLMRDDDYVRTVEHADPTIRVPLEVINALEADTFLGVPNADEVLDSETGVLTLDTAGEYQYKPTGEQDGDAYLFVRIGGADDPDSPRYNPNRRPRG